MTSHASIQSFFLEGHAGRLEAVLNVGGPDAEYACVVAHPHPLFGGTMHNKVVFHAMKALHAFGFPVLRFNFRGVGTSAGQHDYGRGEIDDVNVAIDWLAREFDLPILFAGFSFGAATGLRAACPDRRVIGSISIGTPVNADGREYTYAFLQECTIPKLMISGAQDEFATPQALRAIYESAAEPKQLILVPDADHFFAGHLDQLRAGISAWIKDVIRPNSVPTV